MKNQASTKNVGAFFTPIQHCKVKLSVTAENRIRGMIALREQVRELFEQTLNLKDVRAFDTIMEDYISTSFALHIRKQNILLER